MRPRKVQRDGIVYEMNVSPKVTSEATSDALGMGLHFVDVPPDVAARIDKFIAKSG